jgi:ADP-ribose pyrophosphatase YjhB (NUDIX family)
LERTDVRRDLSETHMNAIALKSDLLKPKRIRTIAIGIFRRGDSIFVVEGYDPNKNETFFRPLGGGIEFGERGSEALAREMREETGLEIENVRYVGTCENIFTYLGEMGHEIVLVYSGDFADQSVYDRDSVDCQEDDGTPFRGVWKRLDDFGKDGDGPLYPYELMGMLRGQGQAI